MWAEGAFPLSGLLPGEHGDAVGEDPPDFPRLSHSRRLLSAREVAAPSAVFIYEAPRASPEEAIDSLRMLLPDRGWIVVERAPGARVAFDGVAILSARRGNKLVTAIAHRVQRGNVVLSVLTSEQGW
jgi:hypothetical protein